jgi:hypothetical protein
MASGSQFISYLAHPQIHRDTGAVTVRLAMSDNFYRLGAAIAMPEPKETAKKCQSV